jgi:hypothetical protein
METSWVAVVGAIGALLSTVITTVVGGWILIMQARDRLESKARDEEVIAKAKKLAMKVDEAKAIADTVAQTLAAKVEQTTGELISNQGLISSKQDELAEKVEAVRHATNSLLDARVKAAKDEGAIGERDRQASALPETPANPANPKAFPGEDPTSRGGHRPGGGKGQETDPPPDAFWGEAEKFLQ